MQQSCRGEPDRQRERGIAIAAIISFVTTPAPPPSRDGAVDIPSERPAYAQTSPTVAT